MSSASYEDTGSNIWNFYNSHMVSYYIVTQIRVFCNTNYNKLIFIVVMGREGVGEGRWGQGVGRERRGGFRACWLDVSKFRKQKFKRKDWGEEKN